LIPGKKVVILRKSSFFPKDKLVVIISRVFLLRQIWIVKYSVKYSTDDCKYLIFLQDFLFRLEPKQYKKMPTFQIWKLIKQNKLFDGIFEGIFDNPCLSV
jgi:hypothetical protein